MDGLDPQLDSSGHGDKDDSLGMSHPGENTNDDGAPPNLVQSGSDAPLAIDPTQYFRTDPGQEGQQQQVTYRVVQVSGPGEGSDQIMAGAGLPPGTQVAQAVLNSPFSATESGSADTISEPRFYTLPAAAPGDAGEPAAVITNAAGGQFFVMMSPQDVLNQPRNLAPRTPFVKSQEGGRTNRDDRRRATHNEVERRRRDKINTWIMDLAKLIPECAQDHNKQSQSKGGILSKACDHIKELSNGQNRLTMAVKELNSEVDMLRNENEALKQEVLVLRAQLTQHGISDIPSSN